MKKAVYMASGEPTKSFEINHGLGIKSPAFVFYNEKNEQVKIECPWHVFGDENKAVLTFAEELEGIKTILILDSEGE